MSISPIDTARRKEWRKEKRIKMFSLWRELLGFDLNLPIDYIAPLTTVIILYVTILALNCLIIGNLCLLTTSLQLSLPHPLLLVICLISSSISLSLQDSTYKGNQTMLSFSVLFQFVWCLQGPPMLLQIINFLILWLNTISFFQFVCVYVCVCIISQLLYPFIYQWTLRLLPYLRKLWITLQ